MDASALVSALDSLEKSWGSLDSWLNFWTLLVVFGVAVELVALVWEYIREREEFARGIIHSPEKPDWRMYALSFLGALLVTVGVLGEFAINMQAGRIETDIRDDTRKLVSLADGDAARAREETAKLNKVAEDERLARVQIEESIAPRRLTDANLEDIARILRRKFPNRVASVWFIGPDREAGTFSVDIASALRRAGWYVAGPAEAIDMAISTGQAFKENGPRATPSGTLLEGGISVNGERSPDGNNLADAVTSLFNSQGFNATKVESVRRPDQGSVLYVEVGVRPLGPQGDAKLKEKAKANKK